MRQVRVFHFDCGIALTSFQVLFDVICGSSLPNNPGNASPLHPIPILYLAPGNLEMVSQIGNCNGLHCQSAHAANENLHVTEKLSPQQGGLCLNKT
jgi:hypothetical protein